MSGSQLKAPGFAGGYLLAAARNLPERASTFNVASGEARSVASLLEAMRKRSRVHFDVEVDPQLLRPSASDIARVACDASKLRAATGWRPRHSLSNMMQALLDERRAAEA